MPTTTHITAELVETKFTPAAWALYVDEDSNAIAVRRLEVGRNGGAVSKDICRMVIPNLRPVHPNQRIDWPEINANARLIAAAPTLYEALQRLVDQVAAEFTLDGEWTNDSQLLSEVTFERARAALAQARGEIA